MRAQNYRVESICRVLTEHGVQVHEVPATTTTAATVSLLQAEGVRVASLDLSQSAFAEVSLTTDVADEDQVDFGLVVVRSRCGGTGPYQSEQ